MFRIKICGITNREDAIAALEAGADAIGLNFYAKSQRCVSVPAARAITDAIYDAASVGHSRRPSALIYAVGVFVNHSAAEVLQIYEDARLAVAQLHGDEPPEFFGLLPDIPAIRVRRLAGNEYDSLASDVRACRDAVAAARLQVNSPCAVLVDAVSDQYGGTGETVSWTALADSVRQLDCPLILAGGLTPQNVAEAIRIVRPYAVDVASGVESAPGKKDPAKVRDFVVAAQAAFAAI